MNNNPEQPDPWSRLVDRARRDEPPAIDIDALLRVTRAAHAEVGHVPDANWLADFSALFCTPRMISACLLLTVTCSALSAWRCWSLWQDVSPWAELVNDTLGGLS